MEIIAAKLRIHTNHSNEIHGLVQSRLADIGFVFSRVNYPNIISRPVYRELMYLICQKNSPYHDDMDCKELECVSKCKKMQFRVDLAAFQGDFPQA